MRLSTAQFLRFCGRQFSPAELDRLRHWLAEGQCHRSELARRASEEFGWVNGAGQLKLMSCRVALLRMERAGLLRLPTPQKRNGNGRRSPLAAPAAFALPPSRGFYAATPLAIRLAFSQGFISRAPALGFDSFPQCLNCSSGDYLLDPGTKPDIFAHDAVAMSGWLPVF